MAGAGIAVGLELQLSLALGCGWCRAKAAIAGLPADRKRNVHKRNVGGLAWHGLAWAGLVPGPPLACPWFVLGPARWQDCRQNASGT